MWDSEEGVFTLSASGLPREVKTRRQAHDSIFRRQVELCQSPPLIKAHSARATAGLSSSEVTLPTDRFGFASKDRSRQDPMPTAKKTRLAVRTRRMPAEPVTPRQTDGDASSLLGEPAVARALCGTAKGWVGGVRPVKARRGGVPVLPKTRARRTNFDLW